MIRHTPAFPGLTMFSHPPTPKPPNPALRTCFRSSWHALMHSLQRSESSWPIKGRTRTATLTRLHRSLSPSEWVAIPSPLPG